MNKTVTVTPESVACCKAMLHAFHWTCSVESGGYPGEPSIADFLRQMNQNAAEGYVAEKCAIWRKSPAALIASFDRERFAKFVEWCMYHFGERA